MSESAVAEPLARFPALRTSDVGEAESVVADAYVPHRLRAEGALDARLNVVHSGSITIGYLTYGTDARLTAPPMVDSFHLNLTLAGETRVRQGRIEAGTRGGRSGAMLSPTEPLTVDWGADAAQFAMKIHRSSLESQLSALLDDTVVRPLTFALRIDLAAPPGAALLSATRFLAEQLELQETMEDVVRRHMESFILTQVLLAVPNSYSRRLTGGDPRAGRSALATVLDYIDAHPQRPLDLAELTAVAGASASALRRAFRDGLGTTPADYVRSVRLAAAHRELTGHEPADVPLPTLAARSGFASARSFARAYRLRYGRPPAAMPGAGQAR